MPVTFNKGKSNAGQQHMEQTGVSEATATAANPGGLKEKFSILKGALSKAPVKPPEEAPQQKATAQLKPAFFKKGAAAQQALKQEEEHIETLKSALWRYYMGVGEEKIITFLDGNLDESGVLDCPMWWEHHIQLNGDWRNWFVCVRETEPCPLCEIKDSYPTLVAGLSIIDHSEYQSKKSGIIKDTVKLFVCKRNTLKILQKKAAANGGLAGCTFEVSRMNDQSPNVGDMFEFMEKNTLADLSKEFGTKEKPIIPVDFSTQIIYRDATELRKMGFGAKTIVGGENPYGAQL